MTDLARQAAEHLTRIVWGDFADPEEGVADVIRSHGTLISHEDAALLREVERLRSAASKSAVHLRLSTCCDEKDARRQDFTAALKSALDAAGVPEVKGT